MSFCAGLGMGRARLWRGRGRHARKNTCRGGKVGARTCEHVPALEPGQPRRVTLTCHTRAGPDLHFPSSKWAPGVSAGDFQWEKPVFPSPSFYPRASTCTQPPPSLLLLLAADGWMRWGAQPPAHPPGVLVPAPQGRQHLFLRLTPLDAVNLPAPQPAAERSICARQPKQGISLPFARGFIPAQLPKTGW